MATVLTRGWKSKSDVSSSRFTHLLESNGAPTEEESRLIRDLIRAMAAELEVLLGKKTPGDKEFWFWKKANVGRRTRKLAQNIQRYASILSIIRVIPAEIIQYIFLLSETSPWTLSRICRDWRHYAQSFPLLWACIPTVRIRPKSKKRTAEAVKKCTHMLHYSSNAPLTVALRSFSRDKRVVDDPVLNLLVSHAHRWRRAKIMLPVVAVANLPRTINGHLPSLQTLWLSFVYTHDDLSIMDIDTFADTPHLKSLHIEGDFSGNIKVKAPELTHLTCHWPPPFGLSTLSQFVKLESLHISSLPSLFVESVPLPSSIMVFPQLQQLTADLSQDNNFSLLQSIAIPSIAELLLKLPSANPIPHVITMLIRSGQQVCPTIRHFQLRTKAVPEAGQTTSLLRLMPELQTFEISMPHFDDINEFAKIDDPVHMLVSQLETCSLFFEGGRESARPNGELCSAIKAFVLNRCETPRNVSVDGLHSMKVFELGGQSCDLVTPFDGSFRDMRYLPIFTQANFENWTPTHRLQELVSLHERLIEQIPNLYNGVFFFESLANGWIARTNNILDEAEALEGLDPFDLLISNLHIAIEKLTTTTQSFREYVGKRFSFPQPNRILSKWKALIALHLDKTHWVYTDLGYESFMLYVRNDHETRNSEHMKDAVFGCDDSSVFGTKYSSLPRDTLSFRHYTSPARTQELVSI
ncbi:hypothetical protein D9619_002329 [Psilocybe cf. subviscida]|uniref:F-box domain-containing protein n=1 Tax=Psilocybe cf. subviscida TaxID=2480587 RepID=A0A8H5AWR0_9AGAR|nr:hypothetical protein D9619_002329 [Psilocybe cf. subviscida]